MRLRIGGKAAIVGPPLVVGLALVVGFPCRNRSRGQVLENKGFRGVKGCFLTPKRHIRLAKPLKIKALTP